MVRRGKRDSRSALIGLAVLGGMILVVLYAINPNLFAGSRQTPTQRPTLRSTPRPTETISPLEQTLSNAFLKIPSVISVDLFSHFESAGAHTLVLEITVKKGAVSTTTAEALFSAASLEIPKWEFFSAILSDTTTAADFVLDLETEQWTVTQIR